MSIIERIDVFPVRLPVSQTFAFASGAVQAGDGAPHVYVKVTDSDGVVGWGEGRPSPAWSYDTFESVVTTLKRYLAPAVVGLSPADRHGLHRRMHAVIGRGPSTGQPTAKSALDLAVHDACARAAGLPLRALLGGSPDVRRMPLSYTVTAHDAGAASEQVRRARAEGYRHFNFKAAVTPARDVDVARAIRSAAGEEAFVWADANQGFRLHEARRIAAAFADEGVDVLEQPLPADQGRLMRDLRHGTRIALAVDETSVSAADFLRCVGEQVVDYLVVKPGRTGGIWPTMLQAATAEAAGLPMLVSGLTESLLGKMASLQVAAAWGYDGPSALNGSQFIDESRIFPNKARVESEGHVTLPVEPGIGVSPDEAALRELSLEDLG